MYYSKTTRGFHLSNDDLSDGVKITLERHAELMQAQSEGAEIMSDENGAPIAKVHVITLEQVKSEKMLSIKSWASSAEKAMTDEYTAGEMASWPTQRVEADALIVDAEAPAPMLRGIASERGLEVVELANKVKAKNDIFATAAAQIYGRRQTLVDQVEAAQSIADVHKIIVVDNGEP